MPMLAIRNSENRNAVSELHGETARKMWRSIWPDIPVEDIPINHITNGVHTSTWIARRLHHLYSQHLGADWIERIDEPDMWESIHEIPDPELWMHRMELKTKLVNHIREQTRSMWLDGMWHPAQVVASGILLNPDVLTIGFARRFAPYKRANLIMSDLERLLKIINHPETPVQILFAGKSHPDHEDGKLLIQEVYRAVKDPSSGGRLVFLEDYNMKLARRLIQGVDVWLNTPRRPNEASGTSGQKAALNGVLNFSILDGWWREGFNGQNGWAIGEDIEYTDPAMQDSLDAASLYNILENEIVPLYYQMRTSDGVPVEWVKRMKESIRTLAPQFSTRRMVIEYMHKLYVPAMEREVEAVHPA
jgi:starch phosphorylase